MTYELAKKLKDTGFPQNEHLLKSCDEYKEALPRDIGLVFHRDDCGLHRTFDYSIYPTPTPDDWTQGKVRASWIMSREYLDSEEGKHYTVYCPTLSELIEACPREIPAYDDWTADFTLRSNDEKWDAGYYLFEDWKEMETGKTPEEAVANLWLALNKKET